MGEGESEAEVAAEPEGRQSKEMRKCGLEDRESGEEKRSDRQVRAKPDARERRSKPLH